MKDAATADRERAAEGGCPATQSSHLLPPSAYRGLRIYSHWYPLISVTLLIHPRAIGRGLRETRMHQSECHLLLATETGPGRRLIQARPRRAGLPEGKELLFCWGCPADGTGAYLRMKPTQESREMLRDAGPGASYACRHPTGTHTEISVFAYTGFSWISCNCYPKDTQYVYFLQYHSSLETV